MSPNLDGTVIDIKIPASIRLVLVEVSTPSWIERTVTPRSVRSCRVLTIERMLRPSRSSRHTIRVSPLRESLRHAANPGPVVAGTGHYVVEDAARPGGSQLFGLLFQSLG
jgi:hypothetical protein